MTGPLAAGIAALGLGTKHTWLGLRAAGRRALLAFGVLRVWRRLWRSNRFSGQSRMPLRPGPPPLDIERIDHVNMRVADLAASIDFYRRVFGFELKEDQSHAPEPWAIVGRAGIAYLCLYEHRGKQRPNDGLLIVHFGFALPPGAFDAAQRALEGMGVTLQFGGAVSWPRSRSLYVVDPSGHVIELAEKLGGGLDSP